MPSHHKNQVAVFFLVPLLVVLGVTGIRPLALADLLGTPDFKKMRGSVTVHIKLADGTKSTRQVGPKAPGWVALNDISKYMASAVISSEDTSFYSHKGVDYYELKESIKKDLSQKRFARGASTITEQVIKNTFLSPEKSLSRKMKEIVWASKMEGILSKKEILCFYLNLVEFGPGIYGVGAASNHYFSTVPANLTVKQSAFLAMLLPSPIKYHIYFVKKSLTVWATKRINQILRVMNRMNFITTAEYDTAINEGLWGEKPLMVDPGQEPLGEDREINPGNNKDNLPKENVPKENLIVSPSPDASSGSDLSVAPSPNSLEINRTQQSSSPPPNPTPTPPAESEKLKESPNIDGP